MSLTFAQQQAFLSVLLGDSNVGTDDAYPTATRKLMINRGELQFAKDSRFLRNTATGTISGTSLAVPSDFLSMVTLIVNSVNLETKNEVSIQEYEKYYSSGSAYPYYYMSEESGSRYFKFFGSSNGQTYKIYYIRKPTTALSADSDESLFPDEFREASVYWAASELLQQLGKNQISDKFAAKYNKYVREAQQYAEENYLNIMYPHPDFNYVDTGGVDVAGGGF